MMPIMTACVACNKSTSSIVGLCPACVRTGRARREMANKLARIHAVDETALQVDETGYPDGESANHVDSDGIPVDAQLRSLAMDYAIKTHGEHFSIHRDGPQIVTNAAAEYLRFLKTGEVFKVEVPDAPEQAEPAQDLVQENSAQPADDGDPLMPLFRPQADLNPAQARASNSFHHFVAGLVENVPRGHERAAAMQALIAARGSVLRACAGEGAA